jgi:acyl carrier protein
MRNEIKEIFVEALGVDQTEYSEDLSYNGMPEWDSGSQMVMAVSIEERFQVELDSDEIVYMTNIKRIYEVLQRKGIPLN